MDVRGVWLGAALAGAVGAMPAGAQVAAHRPAPDWSRVPARLAGERMAPRPRAVTFRLDPALGNALPELRAALARHDFVQVTAAADDAAFELNSARDYPLTLVLRRTASPSGSRLGEMSAELGNLALGDWREPFDAALARIGRRAALMALPRLSPDVRATSCWRDRRFGPIRCSDGGAFVPVDDELTLVPNKTDFPIDYAVRNDAERPRYLALVDITADAGEVRAVPLGGGRPVAAGAWAVAENLPRWRGGHTLVTISSAAPIPEALLRADAPGSAEACAGALGAVLCGRWPDAPPPWAAAAVRYELRAIPEVEVGGGLPAPTGRAPWMAALYSTVPYTRAEIDADRLKPPGERDFLAERSAAERDHRCGGSRIAPDLVLTAAHCVAKGAFAGNGARLVFARRRVRLGSEQLGWGGTTYAIDGMAIHAGYRGGGQRDDIALLHIRADRDTDPAAAGRGAIALPAAGDRTGAAPRAPVAAFGWGYTEEVAPGARAILSVAGRVQRNPERLQVGELEVMAPDRCRARVGPDLTANMLCAVTRTRGPAALRPAGQAVFSCVGDSGGPLVRSARDRDVLVGIASWSRGCGHDGFPSIYTDVARYAGWIAAARARITPGQVVLVPDPARAPLPAPAPRPERRRR